ncbi:MAG TPA: hypothetical protein VFK45_07440, partial [Gammaproteobacteria bacterium]|nr:hypothetical protein [Gammaproteobacteria bacterium]
LHLILPMKIFKQKPRGLDWLIFFSITGLIASVGIQAAAAGHGQEWLWRKMPAWLVVEMITAGTLLRGCDVESRSLGERLRRNLPIVAYFALCTVAGVVAKYWLSDQWQTIYVAFYWLIAGVTIVVGSWCIRSSPTVGSAEGQSINRLLAILLLLTGIASGSILLLWGSGIAVNSPAIAFVTALLSTPLLLWSSGRLRFKPLKISFAKQKADPVGR